MFSKRSMAAALSSAVIGTSMAMAAPAMAADMAVKAPPPPAACGSVYDFFFTACPLTWYGVTFYGTVDMGGSYMTHGAPFDPNFPTGVPYLIGGGGNNATNRVAGFFQAPNGMSQSNVGIKIQEPIAPGGWKFVAQFELAFDPYSGLLANAPEALQKAVGTPYSSAESPIDSSRWGWLGATNVIGFSQPVFGTLTFGRQNALLNDMLNDYDPMSAAYAFSPIGFSGKFAGAGDTEEARWTTAIKYRVNVGDLRFAIEGQPISGAGGGLAAYNPNDGAIAGQIGGDIKHVVPGTISLDFVGTWERDAVNITITGPSGGNLGTGGTGWPTGNLFTPLDLKATLSNQLSFTEFAKWDLKPIVPLTFFAGYEWIQFTNPSNPLTAYRDDGFLFLNGNVVFDSVNNNFSGNDSAEHFHIMWTGAKYGITKDLDVIAAYYHYIQSQYINTTACSIAAGNTLSNNSRCYGWLDAASLVFDWRFLPKWDWYIGTMYSAEYGGIANGSLTRNNVATTTGVRFRF